MKLKKYIIDTSQSIQHFNVVLYRIRALIDFDDIRAGDYGGYVESEKNLSHFGNCWIYDNAKVYGCGRVNSNAKVYNRVEVRCEATISDNAKVFGEAIISGEAKVYGNASISGVVSVFDKSRVFDNAIVGGTSIILYGPKVRVFENAHIYNAAKILGKARVFGNATVKDKAIVKGNAKIYGAAIISENAQVMNKARIYTKLLPGNYETVAEISGNACINKRIRIFDLKINTGLIK
jgi:UDP-3-O-[3-hydroxymyristoyl] glucosamine N-acyltransferase